MEVPKPEYRVSDVKPSLQMMARLLMPKTDYLVFSIEADRKKNDLTRHRTGLSPIALFANAILVHIQQEFFRFGMHGAQRVPLISKN